jgi:hypothetical protein
MRTVPVQVPKSVPSIKSSPHIGVNAFCVLVHAFGRQELDGQDVAIIFGDAPDLLLGLKRQLVEIVVATYLS